MSYDYLYKYLILGDPGVGKTSLLIRFVDDSGSLPEIIVDYKTKDLVLEGKKVKLQIWDTAGQERFKRVVSSYYRFVTGILLVYDITNLESFQNLDSWLTQIEKYAQAGALKILIGSKNDLEKDRKVTFEQGKEFADKNGMKFFETSAKESTNVKESFLTITEENFQLSQKK
jgi:Ras-related protein Rab-1A